MEEEAIVFNPDLVVSQPRSAAFGGAMPLSMVRAGEKVRVKSVTGKDESRHFLGHIGFVEDAEVSVVTEMNGNVIVSIKGTRVAISKAMANRVLTAQQEGANR
jgi:ferrous iron transport protein A